MANSSTSRSILTEMHSALLFSIAQMEKDQSKLYRRMVKAAFTDELSKCLDPVATDHLQHLQRIKLLKKGSKAKRPTNLPPLISKTIRYKKASFEQDLLIIEQALACQHEKLAIYELLHPLTVNLHTEIMAEMVQQTIADNRNTNKWLRQILQNIVAPSLSEQVKSA